MKGMYIHEAAMLAHRQGKGIARIDDDQIYIIPTNTAPCCIVGMTRDPDSPKLTRHWNPTLDDLTQPVWKVR